MNTVLAASALLSLALAQALAPIVDNNPSMATYQALLNSSNPVQGSITGVSNQNGTGVIFNINFYSFPSSGAPFEYQIHTLSVPDNGSCAATGGIFEPYSHSTSTRCDATNPASCEIGDLSGKYGNITLADGATSFQKLDTDLYLSTEPGTQAYFGSGSIVILASDGTAVNCASFQGQGSAANASASASSSSMASMTASSTGGSTASSTGSASSSSSTAKSGAAMGKYMNTGALVAAVAALVL